MNVVQDLTKQKMTVYAMPDVDMSALVLGFVEFATHVVQYCTVWHVVFDFVLCLIAFGMYRHICVWF